MLGAIIGDIVGSRFEWNNLKSKNFDLFTSRSFFTDDSVMTLAVAAALVETKKDLSLLDKSTVKWMQKLGHQYPDCSYGGMFSKWLTQTDPVPYNSFGNGAAMRVSPCAFAAEKLDEALLLSDKVTSVTHNHIEGIKGAQAATAAAFLAREGKKINDIRDYITANYYPLDFTLDEIRDSYTFNETCQQTVPQAIAAFLESDSFEDAIRNAISIGGDSDTLAAITGGIAEAYYGIPEQIKEKALAYLTADLKQLLESFYAAFPGR